MTGICSHPNYCRWYCPISFERREYDTSYVNETQIQSPHDIIKEATLIEAEGAAITGGEPLLRLSKTLEYISLLKGHFGKDFHIHLYTNAESMEKADVETLKKAGLDEIRLHPRPNNWYKIAWCLQSGMTTGVELPAIPFQFTKYKALIRYLEQVGAHFLNLNEFEITESNAKYLQMFGYYLKEDTIAAVEYSEEFALELLEYARKFTLNVHYCSIGYKDGVQLKRRYLRRARNIALPHETIGEDGLLIKAVIFQDGVNLDDLNRLKAQILQQFHLPPSAVILNPDKQRLELKINQLKKLKPFLAHLPYQAGIIEELPLDGAHRIQMTFTPI